MKSLRFARFAPQNWPVAWKLSAAISLIFLVVQAFISIVSDALVREGLLRNQEEELFERAAQQAQVVRNWRDGLLQGLGNAAAESRAYLQPGAGGLASYRPVLHEQLRRLGAFRDLSLLDGHGRVLLSTDTTLEGQDWSSAAWFADAAGRQAAGISHLQRQAGLAEAVFIFYAPVPAGDGTTGDSGYTLAGRLPATALWQIVDPVRVRKSGYIFFSDDNLVAIAHGAQDAEGHYPHRYIFYAISVTNTAAIGNANAQRQYGEQLITRTVNLLELADCIVRLPEGLATDRAAHILSLIHI